LTELIKHRFLINFHI